MNVAPSHEILGVRVQALDLDDLNAVVAGAIASGDQTVIANHNLHSVYLFHTDDGMRAFYDQAEVVHVDGMPLIWGGRLRGLPLQGRHRVTYVDWAWPLLRAAEDGGWRVFYLGATPAVLEAGLGRIRDRHRALAVAGHTGYFDATPGGIEAEAVIQAVNDFAPDILMVGMGMPRQERWIADNRRRLSASVILPSGGCLDYLAGEVPTPPRLAGRLGLEWLCRLGAEPRRLARRYLIEPVLLACVLARRSRSVCRFPGQRP
jgi:N-acetylglucosaminyldiphosphoundecaprenol N-acetyl-beta-D-mannosaminyltransferase